jgi:glycosyltransferase involved in cell wall biosynthesis
LSPIEHLVVHQFDPTVQVAGGTHGVITDLMRFAPPGHEFSVVGVDAAGRRVLGCWEEVLVGRRTIRFLPLTRATATSRRRRTPDTARLVGALLRRRPRAQFALIHSHRVETGAVLSALYPRRPLVQFVHNDYAEVLRHRVETFWRFLPGTYLRLERMVARRADHTIVFNRRAAERLRAVSSRVEAGRNWFDPSVFSPGDDGGRRRFTIGWVGRMEPQKNPLKAAEVLARLADRSVDFVSWFAGAGTLEDPLREALSAAGLHGRVEHMGVVSPPALAARLRETDVLLMTSRFEGFPRAMVEALACGVPVVSTAVGDARAVVREGENGFLADEGSAAELAEGVLRARALPRGAAVARTVEDLRADMVVPELFARLAPAHG